MGWVRLSTGLGAGDVDGSGPDEPPDPLDVPVTVEVDGDPVEVVPGFKVAPPNGTAGWLLAAGIGLGTAFSVTGI